MLRHRTALLLTPLFIGIAATWMLVFGVFGHSGAAKPAAATTESLDCRRGDVAAKLTCAYGASTSVDERDRACRQVAHGWVSDWSSLRAWVVSARA